MRVEQLDLAAAGEVLTLQRAAFGPEVALYYPAYTDPLTQTLEELRAEVSGKESAMLGVREDGRLIAAIRAHHTGPGVAKLVRLSVAPDQEGRGIGRALVEAVKAIAPRLWNDVTTIDLGVSGSRPHLHDFYESMGFHFTQKGTDRSPDEWLMRCELPPTLLV